MSLALPATLTVTRAHPNDVQDRPTYIDLDGDERGILRFGRTFHCELSPGAHRVKAHNTLFGHTLDLQVEPGEDIRLHCSNGLTGGGMLMVPMLGVAFLRVRLERQAPVA